MLCYRFWRGRMLALALVAALTSPPVLHAQEEKEAQVVRSIEGVAVVDKANPNAVNLRPNTSTRETIFVLKDPDALSNAKAFLVLGTRVLAEGTIKELDKVDKQIKCVVKFAPPKDAGDKPLVVTGPPFELKLLIKAGEAEVVEKLKIAIREPKEFVDVAPPTFVDNKLQIKVKMRDKAVGQAKCPIKLVLGPEFLPPASATLEQNLTVQDKNGVVLSAEGLAFKDGATQGRVSLTVDGYERAFQYKFDLTSAPTPVEPGQKIGVAIRAPRFAKPTDKLTVRFELDGRPEDAHTVELGIDKDGAKERFEDRPYSELRQQTLELSFKDGDLLWKTSVRDWEETFDVTGVKNKPIWFRVRIKKKGQEGFLNVVTPESAGDPHYAKTIPDDDSENPKAAFARVILDETPITVEFKNWKDEWQRGKPLRIQASAGQRTNLQAPIEEVLFLLGKYPTDGKISDEAILAKPRLVDAKQGLWEIDYTPRGKDDTLAVTALFKTRLDFGKKTAMLGLVDPPRPTAPGEKASPKLAKIRGRVMHGDLPKPDLSVGLADAKGLKDVVKTDANGDYEFKDVPPGVYVVYSGTSFPRTAGQAVVTIRPGQELADNVAIGLQAKAK